MIAATPAPAAQIHNLVLNVRSFDSIARNVWGGDAAVITLRIDNTLIRIDRLRHGTTPKLAGEIATLQKQGAVALRTYATAPVPPISRYRNNNRTSKTAEDGGPASVGSICSPQAPELRTAPYPRC